MKAKKKWMFLGLTVLVVVAAGLGYWKRIGIRNTLYRMLDKQIPLTGDVYGYYGQEVKVKENLNEETRMRSGMKRQIWWTWKSPTAMT